MLLAGNDSETGREGKGVVWNEVDGIRGTMESGEKGRKKERVGKKNRRIAQREYNTNGAA